MHLAFLYIFQGPNAGFAGQNPRVKFGAKNRRVMAPAILAFQQNFMKKSNACLCFCRLKIRGNVAFSLRILPSDHRETGAGCKMPLFLGIHCGEYLAGNLCRSA
ncbi:hypothetical protein ACFS07_14295 [Undibacterium arcticum]